MVLDYMCGTGYLLARIQDRRPDLTLVGCDIHEPFVGFARAKYKHIDFHHADALVFNLHDRADIILCTGGLHHVDFRAQDFFIDKLFGEAGVNTTIVIGEEVIGDYTDGLSRMRSARRHGKDLLRLGKENNWPAELIKAATEVMNNDVFLRGEYKRCISEWMRILTQRFDIVSTEQLWKAPRGGGDVVFTCKKRIMNYDC
jgi:SAM-dependent methyltransferase